MKKVNILLAMVSLFAAACGEESTTLPTDNNDASDIGVSADANQEPNDATAPDSGDASRPDPLDDTSADTSEPDSAADTSESDSSDSNVSDTFESDGSVDSETDTAEPDALDDTESDVPAEPDGSTDVLSDTAEPDASGDAESDVPSEPCEATLCGSACSNLDVDPDNCGACGITCPASEVCVAGACQASAIVTGPLRACFVAAGALTCVGDGSDLPTEFLNRSLTPANLLAAGVGGFSDTDFYYPTRLPITGTVTTAGFGTEALFGAYVVVNGRLHELVNGGRTALPGAVQPGFESGVRTIVVGGDAGISDSELVGCAIFDDGQVACWDPLDRVISIELPAPAQQLAVGPELDGVFTVGKEYCAIVDDGTVYCWTESNRTPRTRFSSGSRARDLDMIAGTVCARMDDRRVRCVGPFVDSDSPVTLVGLSNIVEIELVEFDTACVRNGLGNVSCFGNCFGGRCAIDVRDSLGINLLPGAAARIDIASPTVELAGTTVPFARGLDGQVRGWGSALRQAGGRPVSEPLDLVPRAVHGIWYPSTEPWGVDPVPEGISECNVYRFETESGAGYLDPWVFSLAPFDLPPSCFPRCSTTTRSRYEACTNDTCRANAVTSDTSAPGLIVLNAGPAEQVNCAACVSVQTSVCESTICPNEVVLANVCANAGIAVFGTCPERINDAIACLRDRRAQFDACRVARVTQCFE